jgi:hypothetical protein
MLIPITPNAIYLQENKNQNDAWPNPSFLKKSGVFDDLSRVDDSELKCGCLAANIAKGFRPARLNASLI